MALHNIDIVHLPRRLRHNESIRRLVRETTLSPDDFIAPVFVIAGSNIKLDIPSMPGVCQYSIDRVQEEIDLLLAVGVSRIILFGIPKEKDNVGSDSFSENGIIQQALRSIKQANPDVYAITDICMCEYTDHGHCGIIVGDDVDNDMTLGYLQKQVVSHAMAGVDMVAPSGMMDGMVEAIRYSLDEAGYETIPIMSYAVKYGSAFFGPFREAAESAPQFGDRKTYQMDPGNVREGIKEALIDAEEGADIIMVKPALAYLDVIRAVKENTLLPVACYNVSGEYSMIKAAAEKGWIDGEKVMMESLLSMKRAGADIII
ncbi:MAG TPA: porphobilinogen synthase, partial [Candidatus Marinimicrobia bacterium]|nr:porphobilinogen synthase [Candidatus Neomarinimicrobiota bacterium]